MAKLTDSEWKVLNALWAGGPQTLGQVLERLEGDTRSEERRVGKECRSRWSPYH